MADLFSGLELDQDLPEPEPRPALTGKPVPTFQLHLCSIEGCYAWGGHGYFSGDISTSVWFCREHAPEELRLGKRAA